METSTTDFVTEEDLLPDSVLDQLEANLGEDCLSCALPDSGPLNDREARA